MVPKTKNTSLKTPISKKGFNLHRTATNSEVKKKPDPLLSMQKLSVYFDDFQAVKNISINIPEKKVVAIMGPSGCGKSTLIRTINRMHDLTENARVEGTIMYGGNNILAMSAIEVRRSIGMVFQRPNPFPNMTIAQNVLAGYLLTGTKLSKDEASILVEENLNKAALWNEVKDRLNEKGGFLSGGQQQRLCIARCLAMKVGVLLLDEPTSALDPIATTHIENLITRLRKEVTIIMVTHNTAQASRISDFTAFMYLGEMIEFGKTKKMFTVPKQKKTEEYLMGKFG